MVLLSNRRTAGPHTKRGTVALPGWLRYRASYPSTMSRTVTTTVADLRAGLTSLSGAWAAWRDAASNAHLAAVMGPLLSRHLRFDDEYSAADSIGSDPRLRREIDRASEVAPGLLTSMCLMTGAVTWVNGTPTNASKSRKF